MVGLEMLRLLSLHSRLILVLNLSLNPSVVYGNPTISYLNVAVTDNFVLLDLI